MESKIVLKKCEVTDFNHNLISLLKILPPYTQPDRLFHNFRALKEVFFKRLCHHQQSQSQNLRGLTLECKIDL